MSVVNTRRQPDPRERTPPGRTAMSRPSAIVEIGEQRLPQRFGSTEPRSPRDDRIFMWSVASRFRIECPLRHRQSARRQSEGVHQSRQRASPAIVPHATSSTQSTLSSSSATSLAVSPAIAFGWLLGKAQTSEDSATTLTSSAPRIHAWRKRRRPKSPSRACFTEVSPALLPT
jgi:hypothetical protein